MPAQHSTGLPNFYLNDGKPIADVLGRGFTLIAIGSVEIGRIDELAEALGMPLKIVRLEVEPTTERLGCMLILIRPDHHIAWRGNQHPADWNAVLQRVVGLSAPIKLEEKVA
jgi:hypothetical protein